MLFRSQATFRLVGQAAPGASSSVSSNGTIVGKLAGTVAATASTGSALSLATNGTLVCKLTATWSAASASNVVSCDDFIVKVVG